MRGKWVRVTAVAAALAIFAAGLWAANRGERRRRHVVELAADGGPRGPAERKAAQYIAAQLARAGVEPAFKTGYSQPVKLRSRQILDSYSSLYLARDGQEQRLVPGEDAAVDLGFDPAPESRAQLVFAGYGLVVPELGCDDLAGLDLRGKIAVVLAGGPPHLPAHLRTHLRTVEQRNIALRRQAGVYGIVTIPNPRNGAMEWQRAVSRRLQPALSLADPAFEQDDDLELSVVMNPGRAEALFEGSGHTFGEVLAAADAGKPLPRFPLATTLRASTALERQATESANVIGILRGSDPELRDQYVVISGRLGDPGAAALLDLAETLHESGVKLRRSLLFAFLTSEHPGLLGSQFFTRYPPVSAGTLVADLDFITVPQGLRPGGITVTGAGESDLGVLVRAASARKGASVREEEGDLPIPGSYYSFLLHQTPSVGFAMEPIEVDRTEDEKRGWRFEDMLLELIKSVANRTARPHWASESYFGRFSH